MSLRNSNSESMSFSMGVQDPFSMSKTDRLPPHSSHPDFGHLILLVFEAVLEVICVSLPGYIVARQGMFDADAQKFVANLNVMLFTPCLSRSRCQLQDHTGANSLYSLHQTRIPIDCRQAG